jgi:hypothetical protein
MAMLQKIKNDNGKTHVCVYAPIGDGERTLCGLACFDAGMYDTDGYSIVGSLYKGKLHDITCPDCLSIINFVKEADNA